MAALLELSGSFSLRPITPELAVLAGDDAGVVVIVGRDRDMPRRR